MYWPHTGQTFFFKRNFYWIYVNNKPISKDYPKNINNLIINPPTPIDSSFYNQIDETVIFSKDTNYTLFSTKKSEFEGTIKDWGLKNISKIDASFQLQNFVMLLSNDNYYG